MADLNLNSQPTPKSSAFAHAHQSLLYESLYEIEPTLAITYKSALAVLEQHHDLNPGRIAQSAHSIREVMEKYERLIGAPDGAGMNALAMSMSQGWLKLTKSAQWAQISTWDGIIHNDLRIFLKVCSRVLPKIEKIRPTIRTKADRVIEKNNLHPLPVPDELKEIEVEKWILIRSFFTETAHKTAGAPSIEIYRDRLSRWEEFMLNLLRPRVVPNQKTILEKIAKAEDANN